MAEQHAGRLAQQFRRLFSFKSGYEPSVADEILPVVQSTFPQASEYFHTRDEMLFGATIGVAQAAGNVDTITWAPGVPGDILVIEQVVVTHTGGTSPIQFRFGMIGEPFNVGLLSLNGVPADNRRATKIGATINHPPLRINAASNAVAQLSDATSLGIYSTPTVAAPPSSVIVPIRAVVVTPTNAAVASTVIKFCFETTSVNVSVEVAIQGWLRTLEPAETF